MNIVDIVIIAILALSVLVGLWRGLISEVLALVTWIAAFWVAWLFGPAVAAHFSRWIESPLVRLVVGYGLCFIAVLIVGALVRFGITRLVDGTGLGGTDRLLGMIFGFARGLLLVTLIVFLAGLTPVRARSHVAAIHAVAAVPGNGDVAGAAIARKRTRAFAPEYFG